MNTPFFKGLSASLSSSLARKTASTIGCLLLLTALPLLISFVLAERRITVSVKHGAIALILIATLFLLKILERATRR
ncbi:MAG: hypothetical protein JWP57_279 [Spirosoma sp.]|nr:hypothetical protein [Spirosoma sp.]